MDILDKPWIFEDTRVLLFDPVGNYIGAWLGHTLPDWFATHLIAKYPNNNVSMPFIIRWNSDEGPQQKPIDPGLLPMAIMDRMEEYRYRW